MHPTRPSQTRSFHSTAGLLCSTALTLSLVMMLAGPVAAQTVTFDEDDPNNDWNLSDTNWQDVNDDPVAFENGQDAFFEDDGDNYIVDITEDVEPGSIYFEDDTSGERTLNGAGGNLSTADDGGGDALQIDVNDGIVNLNVNIVDATNDVIFNSSTDNGGSEGTINMNGDVAGNIQVFGLEEFDGDGDLIGGGDTGTVNLTGTVGGTTTVNSGLIRVRDTGVLTGETAAAGGEVRNWGDIDDLTVSGGRVFNNADNGLGVAGTITGDVSVTAGLLENNNDGATLGDISGAVTISGSGDVNADGGSFGTIDVQAGGDLFVRDNTDATSVLVSGGDATLDDELNSTLDVTDGNVDLIVDVDAGTDGGVTGLTTLSGTGDIDNEGTLAAVDMSGGDLSNDNDGEITGTVNLSGGDLGNEEGGSISGDVFVTGGELNNEDDADITGNVTISGTGEVYADGGNFDEIDVQGGGELFVRDGTDADVTVSGGDAIIDDELDGTLDVTSGTVDLIVDGTTGSVTGLTTLSGTGDIDNEGTLAALDMSGGDLSNDDGGEITGTVNLSGGDLGNEEGGVISGEVFVTGGELNNEDNAEVSGDVTISGTGVVNADGGDFGDIDVQGGGELYVRDGTDADVTVSGGFADLDDELDGTLDVTSGNVDLVERGGTTGSVTGQTTLSGTGDIDNAGTLAAVDISGGTLNNEDGGEITGTLDMSGGDLSNDGGEISGTVNLSGGDLGNEDGGVISGEVFVTGGELNNEDNAEVSGDVTISGTGVVNADGGDFGDIDVQGGGELYVRDGTDADVTVSGGFADLDDELDGTLDVTSGNVDLVERGATTGSVTGQTTVSGGDVDNEGTLAELDMTGGQVDNLSGGVINGAIDVDGGILNNETGADITGDVEISDTGVVNANGGTFDTVDVQTDGELNMTAATNIDLTVSGGEANIDNVLTGSLEVTGGTADIGAAGVFAGTAEVSGGQILNAGSLTDINITGGDVTNELGGTITGTVDVTGGSIGVNEGSNIAGTVNVSTNGTVNLNGGTFTNLNLNGGGLNINVEVTGDIVNDGTNIGINREVANVDPVPGEEGRVVGTIDNIDGTITTETGASVTGLVTNRTDGEIVSNGGTFESGILVEGGEVTIAGATTIGPAGTLTNEEGTVTIDADLTGDVSNTGTMTNNAQLIGNLSIGEGRFTQTGPVGSAGVTGDVSISAGTLEIAGGTFDQVIAATDGNVDVTGTTVASITNTGDGEITIEDGGDMTGDLRNESADSEFDIAGTLDGDLIVTDGTGTITGTIEDTVTLEGGTTTVSGGGAQIDGLTTITDDARLNADGGDFAGGIRLEQNADVRVRGDVTGDVTITSTGGDLDIANAGNLTGTVDQSGGDTTVRGTLTGDAVVAGGTFTMEDGSTVTENVDVDGGTFVGNDATITDGLNVQDGTATIAGTLVADVTTTGGMTTNSGTIDGNVQADAGMVTNAGQITGTLDVDGGAVTNTSGDVAGATTVTDGSLTASGGSFDGGISITGGDVIVSGDIDAGTMTNAGGVLEITTAGATTGSVTHTGGTSDLSGGMASLDVSASGVTTRTGASVTGATTITTGTMDAEGGDFAGGITINGGRLDIEGPVSGDVTNTDGSLIINALGTLTGDVTNADNMRISGTMIGDLTNTADVDARGTITGSVENDAGTFTVASGQSASVTDTLTNADGATVDLEGTLAADVTNEAGGIFTLDDATLTGGFTNFGAMTSDGTVTVSGASRNEGDLDVASGSLTVNNTFTNVSANTLTINEDTTFAADRTVNVATGRIINNGTLAGALENAGTIETTNGIFSGLTANTGQIGGSAVGTVRFAGGLDNDGTVDLSENGTVGDVARIGGAGLSGNGTFVLDIDLSNDVGGPENADYILAEAGAPVTGTINLSFNSLGVGGQQATDIVVLDVDEGAANNFTVSATGLPGEGESIIYALLQDSSNGDAYIADLLNPGIGALAGSIVLTQSLIGSVINRPSSPFVNGLAYEDEDPCGAAPWARFTGGSADSNGQITQVGRDERAFRGEISADFYGLQLGGDFACFNGHFNGWDLAGGGIAGFNEGTSTQPVFALNSTGELSDTITSVTDVEFFQSYAGIYGTAVKDRFVAEMQYRVEQTEFMANNEGRNGSFGLGLTDSEFDSNSSTVSGSVSYAYSIPETELLFVPVAGFAYTQIATDPIIFDDGSIVEVNDFDSRIGFIGGTLSRTKFGEDGTTALNQFVTATYYNDFADNPESQYTSGDGLDTRIVSTENLGNYTELSAGVNYVKILDVGNSVNAKQLSASARADIRVSDQLESWGVTAQVRLQF